MTDRCNAAHVSPADIADDVIGQSPGVSSQVFAVHDAQLATWLFDSCHLLSVGFARR